MPEQNSEHRLTFDGKGAALIGYCSCQTAFLASFALKNRRSAIRAEHEQHLANVAWAEKIDATNQRRDNR